MSITPYIGEIRMFGGNFAPTGWALCEGQLFPIAEFETLFRLIGTTYGGDGQTTFALPDLRGRIPVHQSARNHLNVGDKGGSEGVTLNLTMMPRHAHTLQAFNVSANTPNPANNLLGVASQVSMYFDDFPGDAMNGNALSAVGAHQPHDNRMPYLCVNFIISLFGLYPVEGPGVG